MPSACVLFLSANLSAHAAAEAPQGNLNIPLFVAQSGPTTPELSTILPRLLRFLHHMKTSFTARIRFSGPVERVTWGGLGVCCLLGWFTVLKRAEQIRRGRVIPIAFRRSCLDRFVEGRIDWSQALDYCELNPSAAARVALAALRRLGLDPIELERAVERVRRFEVDRMRLSLGSLRRLVILFPLLGLLGSLATSGSSLTNLSAGAAVGPSISASLLPLTISVGLAILALVAYDGLAGRVERLALDLCQVGAQVLEALAEHSAGFEPRSQSLSRIDHAEHPQPAIRNQRSRATGPLSKAEP
jgi:biopolymer transport protein ExbB